MAGQSTIANVSHEAPAGRRGRGMLSAAACIGDVHYDHRSYSVVLAYLLSPPHHLTPVHTPLPTIFVSHLLLLCRFSASASASASAFVHLRLALRCRTISLCLRVRLRLLTAGLLLLRAAGGTAEEAAAAAAAAREGGAGASGFGGASSAPGGGRSYNTRSAGGPGGGAEEHLEASARLSRQARLKLLRRACGTLRELDALEESLGRNNARRSGGGGSGRSRGGGKRGPGASLGDGDGGGGLEADGDRALRAHILETCVSIIEEMFVPRAYMAGGGGGGAEGAEWQDEEGGGTGGGMGPMGPEVERIVREEKVRTHVSKKSIRERYGITHLRCVVVRFRRICVSSCGAGVFSRVVLGSKPASCRRRQQCIIISVQFTGFRHYSPGRRSLS